MIEFLKIRQVKSPIRNEKENAGIDFFTPEYSEELVEYIREKNPDAEANKFGIFVEPHCGILIPTGIKSKFDPNIALVAMNKSGVCTKTQLIAGACVIDSSYQGEIHIHVINTSKKRLRLDYGMKLMQFVPLVINTEELIVREDEEAFFTEETSRGSGGFGSTGIK